MGRRTYESPELELVQVADEVITQSGGFNIDLGGATEGNPDDID